MTITLTLCYKQNSAIFYVHVATLDHIQAHRPVRSASAACSAILYHNKRNGHGQNKDTEASWSEHTRKELLWDVYPRSVDE